MHLTISNLAVSRSRSITRAYQTLSAHDFLRSCYGLL